LFYVVVLVGAAELSNFLAFANLANNSLGTSIMSFQIKVIQEAFVQEGTS
jgi:uncharacterized protein YejL (UPF0352 family)